MSVPDSIRKRITRSKIQKLLEQTTVALTESFPYEDTRRAIHTLGTHGNKLDRQMADFDDFPPAMQNQFSNRVNYFLGASSQILGILTRSGSMRNSFEVYNTFRDLCNRFFSKEVYVVISSEWNYIPFTYPMNLQELPEFIIIGLPASESNNTLIFPSAAHELGHSIWLNKGMEAVFSEGVFAKAAEQVEKNPKLIGGLFPDDVDASSDLFAQQMQQQFIYESGRAALRQIEELFCDFIATKIFGNSYLRAFQYLIAPGGGQSRSTEYPATKERAALINTYAGKEGQGIEGYDVEFEDNRFENLHAYDAGIARIADNVRQQFTEQVYQKAATISQEAGIRQIDGEVVEKAVKYFSNGMPINFDASIGELYTAAWEFFVSQNLSNGQMSDVSVLNHVGEIVMKTVESWEFNREFASA